MGVDQAVVAAVYVRVSTEDQVQGYSLQAQEEACRARALSLGATEVVVYRDGGVSGSLLNRPGLNALREAARSGALDLVVIWDPDRLSRTLAHQLLLTDEFEAARVRLEFVNFEWRNTPEGQLFYSLRGAIAQYEKEKIRERTARGRRQKASQGKLPLAFRPYGYDYDREQATLAVNPTEAETVRFMFRWLLVEGMGPNAIARRLNQMSLPTRTGKAWHRGVVRQILLNPVYTGVFYANRWDTTGCGLNKHRPPEERVQAVLRPETEWIPIPVPGIVDPAAWSRAQEVLGRARRLWAGKPKAEYLLSGLLVCGRCQMSMSGFLARDWGRQRRKYTCRRSCQGAPRGWCGRAVPAEPLEAAVWDRIMGWLQDPDSLWETLRDETGAAQRAQELAALDEAEARAEQGRGNVLAVLERGLIAAEQAAASLQRIQERVRALRQRRAAVAATLQQARAAGIDRALWRQEARATLARYQRGHRANVDRRQLVRMVVAQVMVLEETLVVHARWPTAFGEGLTAPHPDQAGTISRPDLQATRKS